MRLGKMELSHTRKELRCFHCNKAIKIATDCIRLTGYNSKVQKNFSTTYHPECLLPYALESREKRGERRGRPRGSNTVRLDPVVAAERRRAQQYVSRYRTAAEDALEIGNSPAADRNIRLIGKYLAFLNPPELEVKARPFLFKGYIGEYIKAKHKPLYDVLQTTNQDPWLVSQAVLEYFPEPEFVASRRDIPLPPDYDGI